MIPPSQLSGSVSNLRDSSCLSRGGGGEGRTEDFADGVEDLVTNDHITAGPISGSLGIFKLELGGLGRHVCGVEEGW